ncbi:VOC family protein [soil metagenome]
MSLTLGSIVWGTQDVPRAVEFWCAALDYVPKREPEDDWASLVPRTGSGVQLSIMHVNDPADERRRHHLDLYAEDPAAEVARLLALGAAQVDWDYAEDDDYIVLADPDDNRFCVCTIDGSPIDRA